MFKRLRTLGAGAVLMGLVIGAGIGANGATRLAGGSPGGVLKVGTGGGSAATAQVMAVTIRADGGRGGLVGEV